METYKITKSYKNPNYSQSKNKVEGKNLTFEQASKELDIIEMLWRKHGGFVLERNEFDLVCEESDGSEVITWSIDYEY